MVCYISENFILPLKTFVERINEIRMSIGNHHAFAAGKKFQKMFQSVLLLAPAEKVVFPFSVPIIFLEPSLY